MSGYERIGRASPFVRARVLYALPLDEQPTWRKPHTLIHDQDGAFLADPDDNFIGKAGFWVARMKAARWTENTRRLAG